MKDISIHPACSIFPPMTEEERAGLKADIAKNGQREPIAVYKNQILDGRNRYLVCQELGIEPDECEIEGGEDFDPVAYALSVNLHRRHLTTAQRSMIGAEAEALLAVSAKERQRQAGGDKKSDQGQQEALVANLPQPISGKARDQAAKLVGVSPRMISDAKAIKQADPALAEEVRKGNISVHAAKKKLAPPEESPPKDAPVSLEEQMLDLLDADRWTEHEVFAEQFRKLIPEEMALEAGPIAGEGKWNIFKDIADKLRSLNKIERRLAGDDFEYRLAAVQESAEASAGEYEVDAVPLTDRKTASQHEEQDLVTALQDRMRAVFTEVRDAWPKSRPGDLLAMVEELAEELCEGAEPPRRRKIKPAWSQRKVSANQITRIDDLLFEVDARLAANDSRTAIKRWVQRSRQAVGKLLKPPGQTVRKREGAL